MASLINIRESGQRAYKDIMPYILEDILHTSPETHESDSNYPFIGKGNIIEGIEAKE